MAAVASSSPLKKTATSRIVGSDWNEGITPWEFGVSFNLNQAQPMLRGTVFTDRGVYRLGEEVRLKAILRHNTPQGIRLLPAGHRGAALGARRSGPACRRTHGRR